MKSDIVQLRGITEALLANESSVAEWIPALKKLEMLIEGHTTFRNEIQDIAKGETHLSSGVAISPTKAAMCMREITRSAMFIKGLAAAIRENTACSTGAVHVLYAGTGPYALLALPLMALFTPEQVKFTLLEIHEQALDSVKMVMKSLSLTPFIAAYVHDDAASYKIPAAEIPDIIISETMNVCLEREPQVSIARNLLTQAPEAVMIPQSVSIEAYLINSGKEHVLLPSDFVGEFPKPERDRIHLGKVFELNKEAVFSWAEITTPILPAQQIEIPANHEERYSPRLLTVIQVFGELFLKDYDTSLTCPRKFPSRVNPKAGETLSFHYELSHDPRLVCTTAAG